MRNERNAGRKSKISNEIIDSIRNRVNQGESIAVIAKEYGITRQALHARLRDRQAVIALDYIIDDECATRIEIDTVHERVHIVNFVEQLSMRAFGVNSAPEWGDLISFLEEQYIKSVCGCEVSSRAFVCSDAKSVSMNLGTLLKEIDCLRGSADYTWDKDLVLPVFQFDKKNILNIRTDTDGYQLKSLTRDRNWFVKAQASFGGILMNDWAVEIIASDICNQLNIPCVDQYECRLIYGGRSYRAVYSKNFELDGYSFISFESLLNRSQKSTDTEEFIRLNAIEKLKWCARELAKAGNLPYERTQKYMIDLAVVDCLVGNVDRHTRNFGLFFNNYENRYEIPLIFDNGMGLFEHDVYRDRYEDYDAAMMNVYVAPYGEDPFDMMELLDQEFKLGAIYPGLAGLEYRALESSNSSTQYMAKMAELCQRLTGGV